MNFEIRVKNVNVEIEMVLTEDEQEYFKDGIIYEALKDKWYYYPWYDLLSYTYVNSNINKKYIARKTCKGLEAIDSTYKRAVEELPKFIADINATVEIYNKLKQQKTRVNAEIVKALKIERKDTFTELLAVMKRPEYLLSGNEIYKIITEKVETEAIKIAEEEIKKKYESLIEELQLSYMENITEIEKKYQDKVKEIEEKYRTQIPSWIAEIFSISGFKTIITEVTAKNITLITEIPKQIKLKYFKYGNKKYKLDKEFSLPAKYIQTIISHRSKEATVILLTKNYNRVKHYHSFEEYDCVGILTDIKIKDENDFVDFIKRLIEAIEIINGDGIALKYPPNLPHIETLREKANNGELEEITTTKWHTEV